MKKSKGFTLVELLAVIVILAVLVLAATPAISNIMQKSQKNAFKSEMLGIAKSMGTAYTEKSGKKIEVPTSSNKVNKSTSIYNVSVKKYSNASETAKGYKYLCMTLQNLVDEQVISKSLSDNYGGYIQMWVAEDGTQYTYINVTNSSYYFQGYTDTISKDTFAPSQTAVSTTEDSKVPTPVKDTKCPDTPDMPKEASANKQGA